MKILEDIMIKHCIRYFTIEEVTKGRKIPFEYLSNIEYTLAFADAMRNRLGFPIVITSSYRNPKLNKLIGGVEKSLHLVFNALDLVPMSGDHKELALMHKYASENRTRLMGVGYYYSFLHIDHRGQLNRYSPVTWGRSLWHNT
jgi:uncharacterized protein YcbK (DUF882 family)